MMIVIVVLRNPATLKQVSFMIGIWFLRIASGLFFSLYNFSVTMANCQQLYLVDTTRTHGDSPPSLFSAV